MSRLPHWTTVGLVCLTNRMWQKWWYDTSEITLCKTLWLPCWSLTFPLGSLTLGEARCHIKQLYGDAHVVNKWDLAETTELQLKLNPLTLLELSDGWSCSQQLGYNLIRPRAQTTQQFHPNCTKYNKYLWFSAAKSWSYVLPSRVTQPGMNKRATALTLCFSCAVLKIALGVHLKLWWDINGLMFSLVHSEKAYLNK